MDTPIYSAFSTGTPSTTKFTALNVSSWNATETGRRVVVPISGVVKNLTVNLGTAPGSGGSGKKWDFTLYKNGSPTALTVTILDAATSATDVTHQVAVVPGDELAWKAIATGGPADPTPFCRISAMIASGVCQSMLVGGTNAASLTNNATTYLGLTDYSAGNATRTNREGVIPTTGKLKNLRVVLDAAPGIAASGAKYDFTLYKNGVATTQTVSILETATSATDTTHTISVAAGDLVTLECIPTNTPTATSARWAIEWEPQLDGESIHLSANANNPSQAVANYISLASAWGESYNSTQANRLQAAQVAVHKKLYVDLTVAPGSGKSYAFMAQNELADTGLTVTVADTATTGNDTTHTFTPTLATRNAMMVTPSGTPAATVVRWGFVTYIAPPTPKPLGVLGVG